MREHDFIAPDLGNPFQHADKPQPVEFEMTTDELRAARERQAEIERDRNARVSVGRSRRPRHGDGPEAA